MIVCDFSDVDVVVVKEFLLQNISDTILSHITLAKH